MNSSILSRLCKTLSDFFSTEGGFILKEISTPSDPPANRSRLYIKSDGSLYKYSNGGSEEQVGGSTGDAALPLGM